MRRAFFVAASVMVAASCAEEPPNLSRSGLRPDTPDLAPSASLPDARTSTSTNELLLLRARFPGAPLIAEASPAVHPARVMLPSRLDGEVHVEDVETGVALAFRLEDAPSAARTDVDGVSIYSGAGVVHRVTNAGIEDSIAFATRPAREEVRYALDVLRVPGLRLVEDTLEALDSNGAPRLRVPTPYVIDADGTRTATRLSLEGGCSFDTNLAGPWGRPVTPPGASRCTLVVRFAGASYPALLDPSWATAGNGTAKDQHAALALQTGKILLAFGNSCGGGCFPTGSAQLYDPVTQTFASTGGAPDKATTVNGIVMPNGKALLLDPSGTLVYDPGNGMMTATGGSTFNPTNALAILNTGKVLIAGTAAALYDPGGGTYGTTGAMNASRTTPAVTTLPGGKVLLVGGGNASAEIYDPVGNTFTPTTGNMAAARSGAFAFTLTTGKVLVLGGGPTVSEIFDPATGMFTPGASFLLARDGLYAAQLQSGKVLVVGGYVGGGALKSATTSTERYDPTTGVFVTGPSLQTPRGFEALTLLTDGTLVASLGRNAESGTFGSSIGSVEQLPVIAAGGVCSADDDCGPGFCDHGVCCAAACTTACHACTSGTGACDVVKSKDDPDTCTGASTCDAAGACKKKLGQTCTAATDCANGFCVDGVCCDRACGGACEACDGLVKGTCAAIAGAPHGARACMSGGKDPVCGGACNGTDAADCAYPKSATGCGASCAAAARTPRACDGKGTCKDLTAAACPGNFTCLDDTTCRTSCTSDGDCVTGYACQSGACAPAGKCDGSHTIVSADGKTTTDCTPFDCDDQTNRCKTTCTSVTDCANPYVCNASGVCVAGPGGEDTSGCNAGARGASHNFDLFGALFALALVLQRRARQSQNS
jgi:hypothetical protein